MLKNNITEVYKQAESDMATDINTEEKTPKTSDKVPSVNERRGTSKSFAIPV